MSRNFLSSQSHDLKEKEMRVLCLLVLSMCLSLSGCATRQMAQEITIKANIGSTTEAEIVAQLGEPKQFSTEFASDGDKVVRFLAYGVWRSEGKYYRLIITNEQGKSLEVIASPDNYSKYTQIQFRFLEGKLIEVFPGYWKGNRI